MRNIFTLFSCGKNVGTVNHWYWTDFFLGTYWTCGIYVACRLFEPINTVNLEYSLVGRKWYDLVKIKRRETISVRRKKKKRPFFPDVWSLMFENLFFFFFFLKWKILIWMIDATEFSYHTFTLFSSHFSNLFWLS